MFLGLSRDHCAVDCDLNHTPSQELRSNDDEWSGAFLIGVNRIIISFVNTPLIKNIGTFGLSKLKFCDPYRSVSEPRLNMCRTVRCNFLQ